MLKGLDLLDTVAVSELDATSCNSTSQSVFIILPAALGKPYEALSIAQFIQKPGFFERKFQSTSAIQINRSILVPSYKYLMGYSELKNTRLSKPKRSSS